MKKIVCLLFVFLLIGTMLCACSDATTLSENTSKKETIPSTTAKPERVRKTQEEIEIIAVERAVQILFGIDDSHTFYQSVAWKDNTRYTITSVTQSGTRTVGDEVRKIYEVNLKLHLYDKFDEHIVTSKFSFTIDDAGCVVDWE